MRQRLVNQNAFFEILNGFYLIWPFILRKKISTAPYKIWQKNVLNWVYRVSEEVEFCSDFKNMQKSWVWQKGKIFTENDFFRTWRILKKNVFLKKKSLGPYWNQQKIPLLLIPFAPNFKELFFHSYKGQCFLLEVKRSNKIENIQYFL